MNFSLILIILSFSLCFSLTHIRQLIKPDYITFDNLSEATSQKFYRRATDYLLRAGVPFAPNDVFLRKLIIAAVAPYLTNSEACSVFDDNRYVPPLRHFSLDDHAVGPDRCVQFVSKCTQWSRRLCTTTVIVTPSFTSLDSSRICRVATHAHYFDRLATLK